MKIFWLLVIVLQSFSVVGQETWEQIKSDSSVIVYTKKEQGRDYKSFKAVAVIPSSTEKILEVLDNVNNYDQWFSFTKSAKLLKIDEDKKYIYMETAFPWPFKSEDMIYIITTSKNNDGEIKLTLTGDPNFMPALDGIKRMRGASGYILLQPKNEYTQVTYVMHTELSGDIPPWLVNKYIHLLPFETLNNLIEFTQQPQDFPYPDKWLNNALAEQHLNKKDKWSVLDFR